MKLKKLLAVLASAALALVLFAGCAGGNGGNGGGNDGIDGTYHTSQSYADITITIDGENVSCVYTDTYNNNTVNYTGTMTEVDDEDGDASTVKYNVTWVDNGSGSFGLKEFNYNAKDKTITAPSNFTTYLFEKQ